MAGEALLVSPNDNIPAVFQEMKIGPFTPSGTTDLLLAVFDRAVIIESITARYEVASSTGGLTMSLGRVATATAKTTQTAIITALDVSLTARTNYACTVNTSENKISAGEALAFHASATVNGLAEVMLTIKYRAPRV